MKVSGTCERVLPVPHGLDGLLSCGATADDDHDLLVLPAPLGHRLLSLGGRAREVNLEDDAGGIS